MREFDDVEVVYSSLTYLYDIEGTVTMIMRSFIETGVWGEAIITSSDARVAVWQALLPASKRDPLRLDGTVDEIMFLAHMCSTMYAHPQTLLSSMTN